MNIKRLLVTVGATLSLAALAPDCQPDNNWWTNKQAASDRGVDQPRVDGHRVDGVRAS